jgi:hypothetical protein
MGLGREGLGYIQRKGIVEEESSRTKGYKGRKGKL